MSRAVRDMWVGCGLFLLLAGCQGGRGGGSAVATPVLTLTVSPPTVTLDTGSSQAFTASVGGSTDQAVTWRVVESGGGSISPTGLYSAPGVPGTFHVEAVSHADPTRTGQATVTVKAPVATLYVANDGSDSSGDGTASNPFRSLRKASTSARAVPGSVIKLRPGVYTITMSIGSDLYANTIVWSNPKRGAGSWDPGSMLTVTVDDAVPGTVEFRMGDGFATTSPNAPGTLLSLQGDSIIFDGANRTLVNGNNVPVNTTSGIVRMLNTRGVVFKNTELQWNTAPLVGRTTNSDRTRPLYVSGTGISFSGVEQLWLLNNRIHHFDSSAIYGHGVQVRVEGNEIHDVVLENKDNFYLNTLDSDGGWAGCINIGNEWAGKTYTRSSDVSLLGNTVRNSWGEGIICGFNRGVVRGNTVADVYAVGIYMNGCIDTTASLNHLYTTGPAYNKTYGPTFHQVSLRGKSLPMYAFSVAMEFSSTGTPVTNENLVFENNLGSGIARGFNFWKDPANTSSANSYKNLKVWHNTFTDIQEAAVRVFPLCDGSGCSTRYFGNELKNNLFVCSGTGITLVDLGDPDLWQVASNLVETTPRIGSIGFAGPSLLPGSGPERFQLTAGTPASIARGGAAAGVTQDFFGRSRSLTAPSLGMHEF